MSPTLAADSNSFSNNIMYYGGTYASSNDLEMVIYAFIYNFEQTYKKETYTSVSSAIKKRPLAYCNVNNKKYYEYDEKKNTYVLIGNANDLCSWLLKKHKILIQPFDIYITKVEGSMKKIISLLITLLIGMTVTIYVTAQDNSSNEFELKINESNTITITKLLKPKKEIIIPAEINNTHVTKIKIIADNDTTVEKIVLPEGLTVIEDSSFSGYAKLSDVNIPSTVQKIGDNSFNGCPIKKLIIPASVTYISSDIFANSEIKEVEFKGQNLKLFGGDFYKAKLLEYVKLPENIKTIAVSSFNGEMTRFEGMFEGCSNLKKIVLPDSVETIDINAFKDCINLEEIYLSKNIKFIHEDAFINCPKLKVINEKKISIDEYIKKNNIKVVRYNKHNELEDINNNKRILIASCFIFVFLSICITIIIKKKMHPKDNSK